MKLRAYSDMKIIHTSDWHLGHTLYDHDRTEEQLDMLGQMSGLASDIQPDLFLLCGDVFHVSQPSAAIQTVFAEALLASPVEAEGSRPIEPLMTEPSSVRISPKVFSVTITSKKVGS